MSVVDKMFGQKSGETENPKSGDNTTSSEKTKTPTLEEVITSTGQDDRTDESKKEDKKPEDDSKDKAIVSLKRDLKQKDKDIAELRQIVTDFIAMSEADKKSKMSDAKIREFAEKRGVAPEDIADLVGLLRDQVAPEKETKNSKSTKEDKPKDEDEEEEETIEENIGKKFDKNRLSKAVDSMLTDFLDDMPEYADIVEKDIVKDLILSNPDKYTKLNMNQIVEKIYGNAIKGNKGIEKMSAGNREKNVKATGKLTGKEFEAIKDDPDAMKSYKGNLLERARKYGM